MNLFTGDNIHILHLHNMQSEGVKFTFLAFASEDNQEEEHGKEGISAASVPAASVGSSTLIKCSLGSKPCKDNAECVLYNHVCDGEADCRDGSDEEECSLACETGILVLVLCGCCIMYMVYKYGLPSSGGIHS